MRYVLALDQGTTSSRAMIFDERQQVVASAQKEFTQYYPQAGWVEHDPEEIWSSQYAVMNEALSKSGLTAGDIAAIGITNQRETAIVWDRLTGEPVYNAIVWQCRRTAEVCEELERRGLRDYISSVTGLIIDPYFSGTKIKWILDNVPGAKERAGRGELIFGTVDTWLIWKLTGGRVHATDYTNASRTMLFDIHKLRWDQRLLRELEIPESMLPEVYPSSHVFGMAQTTVGQIPIAGVAGDQQAALFGQCCFDKGQGKNTYGTGCFLLVNAGDTAPESTHGMVTTIAAGDSVRYALEGSVFVGGAVIQWLRDQLHFINDARDSEYFASKVPDTGGVYLVPAFTGLGAPYWDPYARGTIMGITRGTTTEHIIRAAQESIAYQSLDLLEAMEQDLGLKIGELRVDGGASRDGFLMQFQADIMDRTIFRPQISETTALGAAYLAGLASGVWDNLDEIRGFWQCGKVFDPAMDKERRQRLLAGWHRAVGRSQGWARE